MILRGRRAIQLHMTPIVTFKSNKNLVKLQIRLLLMLG